MTDHKNTWICECDAFVTSVTLWYHLLIPKVWRLGTYLTPITLSVLYCFYTRGLSTCNYCMLSVYGVMNKLCWQRCWLLALIRNITSNSVQTSTVFHQHSCTRPTYDVFTATMNGFPLRTMDRQSTSSVTCWQMPIETLFQPLNMKLIVPICS